MAKDNYTVVDSLPPSTRGGNAGAYTRFTDAATANPGKWVSFNDLEPKSLGAIVNTLRKRGFEAAQRSGVLYVLSK
jgi:hypothetical protein